MKGIFVIATGQNVGKTTVCLGLISGLKKIYEKLGFMKPVGQQHVKVPPNILVDKDVVLFKDYFDLPFSYPDMSPVIFSRGFTKDYLDGKITDDLTAKIQKSFNKIAEISDYTVVEGTGHVGVGSIVKLSNAAVAKALGLDVVLIAEGGLGSSFDEIALNKSLCDLYNVKFKGIILNRVLKEKQSMVETYMKKALSRWNIPLIGSITYNQFLNTPTMENFEDLFQTTMISGENFHYRHFETIRLVATSLETFKEVLMPNQLIVTPATREDIVLAVIERHEIHRLKEDEEKEPKHGLILTGRHPPTPSLIEKLKQAGVPALYAALNSYEAMKLITTFTAKIDKNDLVKVKKAIDLVEKSIDFSHFL